MRRELKQLKSILEEQTPNKLDVILAANNESNTQEVNDMKKRRKTEHQKMRLVIASLAMCFVVGICVYFFADKTPPITEPGEDSSVTDDTNGAGGRSEDLYPAKEYKFNCDLPSGKSFPVYRFTRSDEDIERMVFDWMETTFNFEIRGYTDDGMLDIVDGDYHIWGNFEYGLFNYQNNSLIELEDIEPYDEKRVKELKKEVDILANSLEGIIGEVKYENYYSELAQDNKNVSAHIFFYEPVNEMKIDGTSVYCELSIAVSPKGKIMSMSNKIIDNKKPVFLKNSVVVDDFESLIKIELNDFEEKDTIIVITDWYLSYHFDLEFDNMPKAYPVINVKYTQNGIPCELPIHLDEILERQLEQWLVL